MIRTESMIQDHSDHGASKESIDESILDQNLSVPLMHNDASDLGPLILIWIILKDYTLRQ